MNEGPGIYWNKDLKEGPAGGVGEKKLLVNLATICFKIISDRDTQARNYS